VTLLVLRVEGDRAVSVNVQGMEEAPVHRSAARELARLADLAPSGHVAWLDRRMEAGLTAPGTWPALLRHDLEVLHAGGGSRMAPSLGLVDFDSPWLLDAPPGRRFDTWSISPAAGIARGGALRAVGIEPDGWSFGAALFDLGRRGVPLGLCPAVEPRLLQGPLPRLPELRPVEIARLVRRGFGRRWVGFWWLAERRSLAALRGWLAPGAEAPGGRAALDALRPALPNVEEAAVDVLIPTLGRPEALLAVLGDLGAQTLRPRRVIVVEQGEPLSDLAERSWPFELRRLSLDRPGACRARNAGLAEVRSDWVLLLDDDVRLRPRLIERLVAVARGHGAEAVNGRVHLSDQPPRAADHPLLWPAFSTCATLVSAAALLATGGFDERLEGGYGEDYEIGVRLRLGGARVLYDAAEPVLHLKAPAGGFRAPLAQPWDGPGGPGGDTGPPRPSPYVLYSRRKHLTPEMQRGYSLYYRLMRLGATRPWRWPAELRLLTRQWDRSEYWTGRLLDARTVPGVRRLCIVSHVVHYRHAGKVHAYAPYAREIEMWADLFPEVRIAAPCEDGPPPGDAAPIDRPNVDVDPQPRTGGDSLGAKARQAFLLPVLVASLARALRKADAIHVRCPGNLGLLGILMAPLFSRRLIAKYAGQWNGFPGEARTVRLQRAILRSGWWKGPVTVYGSWPDQPPWIVPFFTSVLDREQIGRARRAAAARVPRAPKARPRVLFVGRLSRAKNVGALLDALARTGLPCTLVGDGPERGALEAQAARLGLDVDFAGAVDFDRVLGFYETHDVLVLASETEGWPKAIVEAMAFGLVCIGSDRGLIPQILGEGRGFVVPPRDVDALAAALGHAADSAEAGPIVERAAAFGQRYSLEDLREALRELMTERWT
jgi:glycosyltransferase involved in cell wall biosynthesis